MAASLSAEEYESLQNNERVLSDFEKSMDTSRDQCAICLNEWLHGDPKMLPCSHVYCYKCLSKSLYSLKKKPGEDFECAICRQTHILPFDGIDGLPSPFIDEKTNSMADDNDQEEQEDAETRDEDPIELFQRQKTDLINKIDEHVTDSLDRIRKQGDEMKRYVEDYYKKKVSTNEERTKVMECLNTLPEAYFDRFELRNKILYHDYVLKHERAQFNSTIPSLGEVKVCHSYFYQYSIEQKYCSFKKKDLKYVKQVASNRKEVFVVVTSPPPNQFDTVVIFNGKTFKEKERIDCKHFKIVHRIVSNDEKIYLIATNSDKNSTLSINMLNQELRQFENLCDLKQLHEQLKLHQLKCFDVDGTSYLLGYSTILTKLTRKGKEIWTIDYDEEAVVKDMKEAKIGKEYAYFYCSLQKKNHIMQVDYDNGNVIRKIIMEDNLDKNRISLVANLMDYVIFGNGESLSLINKDGERIDQMFLERPFIIHCCNWNNNLIQFAGREIINDNPVVVLQLNRKR